MKRTVPLVITAVVGFVLIVSFFIPEYQEWGEITAVWFDILASIAFILGGGNLLKVHLKKISDRARGWGYSAVTIIAFLATLYVGLFKVEVRPAVNTEFYGESFALLPLNALPESRLEGEIPERADGAPLPASVRRQLRQEDGEIVFRGWITGNQVQDLLAYEDTLEWDCLVEQLAEEAQPPEELRGKVAYYIDHMSLAYRGYMSDEDEQRLRELFADEPVADAAIDELAELARDPTQASPEVIPDGIAEAAADAGPQVEVDSSQITVRGPMTPALHENLASAWPEFERVRPLSDEERAALRSQLEALGPALTEDQVASLHKQADTIWTVEALRQALDAAGEPQEVPRTACEMLEEMQAGVEVIEATRVVGEAVTLNDEQADLLQEFATDDEMNVEALTEQLRDAGPFTDEQAAALAEFIEQTPTAAEFRHQLAIELMKAGAVSEAQREFLFAAYREQFAWQHAVSELFLDSQQVKYPWSGDYNAQGSPFWWVYEYVFQPLTATMFAMLAFYVASAAFRAFRAKNLEAILLLGTAFIILLGRTFAGYLMTAWLPDWLSGLRIDQLTVYIMGVFNTAGNRAIMIGIALGIASTSLKVLLGVDRSYLGSGDE